jgi:poly(A) polymerase
MKRKELGDYPSCLFVALEEISKELGQELYLVGGTVRDYLLHITPNDLDFTVDCDAVRCCRALIRQLNGGTFVPLGAVEEDAGRVVWKGVTVDFSSLRAGAETIEEDLRLRDFTINAMGMKFSLFSDTAKPMQLIDPLGGEQDLKRGILRSCPEAFSSDPLRMLRGYRLRARFGFVMTPETLVEISENVLLLSRVSTERVSYEMDLIMASSRSYEVIAAMAESALLFQVIPDLQDGVGLTQPESHHLDVFGHSLSALKYMEQILESPAPYYPNCPELLQEYLEKPATKEILKWGALLHDLGKPATRNIREDKGGRITFYNHDEVGKDLVHTLGRALRWSNEKRDRVAALTAMHMHPFHLCNVRRKQSISKKSCLKLAKRAGEDLIGLFLLSMADSLAGKGTAKPEAMEEELSDLLCEVLETYTNDIKPALSGPRLVTGKDLIDIFSLQPGPDFAKILDELQEVQVEGVVQNREEALAWVEEKVKLYTDEHLTSNDE